MTKKTPQKTDCSTRKRHPCHKSREGSATLVLSKDGSIAAVTGGAFMTGTRQPQRRLDYPRVESNSAFIFFYSATNKTTDLHNSIKYGTGIKNSSSLIPDD